MLICISILSCVYNRDEEGKNNQRSDMKLYYLTDGRRRLLEGYFEQEPQPLREALFWVSEEETWIQQLPKSIKYCRIEQIDESQ